MSLPEVSFRIREEVRKKTGGGGDIEVRRPQFSDKSEWYADLAKRVEIENFVRERYGAASDMGENLFAHRFSFFSFENKVLGDEIDWHRDYKTGKNAPLTFSKSIDYRDYEKLGDIKYIWELNRHLHLVALAKSYYLSQNEAYKQEVKTQILNWIKENPYMRGVNWESSLEVGIRLISWSWVWKFLGEMDEEFKLQWLKSIYKHCYFIEKNFSRFSSANNHLIGEAAGLFVASTVWPYWKESKRWQDKSFKVLVEEMEKQNYKDGVNKEQAISYQQFVLDFFILSGLLGEKNGVKFPAEYWNCLERMLVLVASIMDKDGNMPNIGDADDGYAVKLSEDERFNPFQSLLATGAVIFKRGDFKNKAGTFDEKSFWLLGFDGLEKFESLQKKEFEVQKRFDDGGYYVLSANEYGADEIKAVFDCGPLGYLSLAAHGHADALSFVLSVSGKEIIIDPGTYAYHTQKKWREYFKGTSAHNTIRIDRKNQSLSGGNFMWLKKARAKALKWDSNVEMDIVAGEHDGYNRLNDPVVHRREIMFDKQEQSFKITDNVLAGKRHFLEQYFHFSKDCKVTQEGSNEWEIDKGEVRVNMKIDEKLNSEVFSGNENPILGWESKRFDVKTQSPTVVNSSEIDGNCELITHIKVIKRGRCEN